MYIVIFIYVVCIYIWKIYILMLYTYINKDHMGPDSLKYKIFATWPFTEKVLWLLQYVAQDQIVWPVRHTLLFSCSPALQHLSFWILGYLVSFSSHMAAVSHYPRVMFVLKNRKPWPMWFRRLGIIPRPKRLPVRFPVTAHSWVVGFILTSGCVGGSHRCSTLPMVLPFLPLPLSKISLKHFFKEQENALFCWWAVHGIIDIQAYLQGYAVEVQSLKLKAPRSLSCVDRANWAPERHSPVAGSTQKGFPMNREWEQCLPSKHRACPFYPEEPSLCAVHWHVSLSPSLGHCEHRCMVFACCHLEPRPPTPALKNTSLSAAFDRSSGLPGPAKPTQSGLTHLVLRSRLWHLCRFPLLLLPPAPFQEAASPGSLPLPGASRSI